MLTLIAIIERRATVHLIINLWWLLLLRLLDRRTVAAKIALAVSEMRRHIFFKYILKKKY